MRAASKSSLLLAGLLALSLGAKILVASNPVAAAALALPERLADYLVVNGFTQGAPTQFWLVLRKGACTVEVAEVAPQGWHRAMVRDYAAGRPLFFAFAGQAYDDQPVLLTKLDYYRQRLLEPFHLATATPVHAVVLTNCTLLERQTLAALLG